MTYQPTSYPPTQLTSASDSFNILQITDFHLCYEAMMGNPCYGQCYQDLISSLAQAMAEPIDYDLILVTGDLINEMDSRIYDEVFHILEETSIPFACISGNHDVTDEVGEKNIPFWQRELVAYEADKRLLSQHVIETEHWQLLLLDSSDSGKVSGSLTQDDLQWIQHQLANNGKPAMLALHHHVVPMESAWIDEHMLKNPDQLWQVLSEFEQVKIITFGHVHQEFYANKHNIDLYATPSTSYQFMPKQKEFAIDTEAKAGYRLFSLFADGSHTSKVRRVSVS